MDAVRQHHPTGGRYPWYIFKGAVQWRENDN
jgi:hypothetical protein